MKKRVILLIYLVLGATCLTSCTGNDEAFTQKHYTAGDEEITEVHIDVRDRQIDVTLSTDNQIYIDYFESNKGWTDYIGGKSAVGSRKISLRLPDALLAVLHLSTTNEDISLAELTGASDVSLSSLGGNVVFDQLHVKNTVDLNVKNGNISGTLIGNYDDYAIFCDIKKGKSNLPSSKENGTKKLTASTNNGDIDIEFVSSCYSFTSRTSAKLYAAVMYLHSTKHFW